ncbi:AraC family transcriptional regulator [Paenibacillus sanguinis]|uniref:AraC family transcriptional regulator n=1 Tax=Paenibacillus sanguinis TaxID=225906 RepID=UPI00036DD7C8|nr:AraC family transcriptional regulator [Paenibacillus sanguinis]
MLTEKIDHILYVLTNMEEFYKENADGQLSLQEYSTYIKFLSNNYIKKNHLIRLYWPHYTEDTPKYITDFTKLDENMLILADLNMAVTKHINFSLDMMHSNNYLQCIYIHKGTGILTLTNRTFTLTEGDLFVMPPDTMHSVKMTEGSICIYVMIRRKYINSLFFELFHHNPPLIHFFNKVLFEKSSQEEANYILFHTGSNKDVKETILRLFSEYLWGDEFRNNIMECYLKLLFSFLFRHKQSEIETPVALTNAEVHFNEIMNYINKDFRTATLASTSEYVHLSKQYICKIVKQAAGTSFSRLLIDVKLKKATQYLLESNIKLEDIADFTGFSDVSHFSRIFKQHTGIPPSRYRAEQADSPHP